MTLRPKRRGRGEASCGKSQGIKLCDYFASFTADEMAVKFGRSESQWSLRPIVNQALHITAQRVDQELRSECVTTEIEGPYALRQLRPVTYYVTRKWRSTARDPED